MNAMPHGRVTRAMIAIGAISGTNKNGMTNASGCCGPNGSIGANGITHVATSTESFGPIRGGLRGTT